MVYLWSPGIKLKAKDGSRFSSLLPLSNIMLDMYNILNSENERALRIFSDDFHRRLSLINAVLYSEVSVVCCSSGSAVCYSETASAVCAHMLPVNDLREDVYGGWEYTDTPLQSALEELSGTLRKRRELEDSIRWLFSFIINAWVFVKLSLELSVRLLKMYSQNWVKNIFAFSSFISDE